MTDPLPSLAFAIHAGPGTYALILGSGISRAAKIPTGWEVVTDLVRKLAAVSGEAIIGTPEEWYETKFGAQPDYSTLLAELAPTPPARSQLLRGYFEPSDDHRSRGERVPTSAHHAIAKLVATGYVRVVITTNFDRLLEDALSAMNLQPQIISSADAVVGMTPLAHSKCTVIKVHGDYLDSRIRNTPSELERYDPTMDRLLDQVFDEYGLLVAGWSADYDVALLKAIERSPNRRFPLYFTHLGPLGANAQRILTHRRGLPIRISGADPFFIQLEQMVEVLEKMDAPHPLTAPMAVAQLKGIISRGDAIQRHDLLETLQAPVIAQLRDPEFQRVTGAFDSVELRRRVQRYELLLDPLIRVFATGGYWEGNSDLAFYVRTLKRVLDTSASTGADWENLRMYPALLLRYAAGLGAVVAEKYRSLAQLYSIGFRRVPGAPVEPAVLYLHPLNVMRLEVAKALPNMTNRRLALSDHLYELFRPVIAEYVESESSYDRAFAIFEYLQSVAYLNRKATHGTATGWAPLGRYHWQQMESFEPSPIPPFLEGMNTYKDLWPPFAGGLFEGKFVDVKEQIEAFEKFRRDVQLG